LRLFNLGLYRQILEPLGISATCNPNLARPPAGQPRYHTFFDLARSYNSPGDDRGILLDDTTATAPPAASTYLPRTSRSSCPASAIPRFSHRRIGCA
jgi:hypothetical protein